MYNTSPTAIMLFKLWYSQIHSVKERSFSCKSNKSNSKKDRENWFSKIKNIKIQIGIIEKKWIFHELTLIFNIITTNKNKTAIAPTYTMINIKDKNSAPRSKSKLATLQKTKIKKRTECTALDKLITIKAANNVKQEKRKNKKISKFILRFFAKKRTRTFNFNLGKVTLYHLSYFRIHYTKNRRRCEFG